MTNFPSIEKLYISSWVFNLLENGQTLENLKDLEIHYYPEDKIHLEKFKYINFTGLESFKFLKGKVTAEHLQFIDKSAVSLKKLEIDLYM